MHYCLPSSIPSLPCNVALFLVLSHHLHSPSYLAPQSWSCWLLRYWSHYYDEAQ